MTTLVQTRSRRAPIHRALVRFPLDRPSAIAGICVAIAIVAAMFAFSRSIWNAEAHGVTSLLRMSHTPFSAPSSGHRSQGLFAGGATFVVSGSAAATPRAAAIAGIAAFLLASIVAVRWRRIAVPAKVLWLLFAAIGCATLLYTAFHSGASPHRVNELTIDFQRGGLLGVIVASLLFAFEVFPVPGPFRIKLAWLAGLVVFSFAWSVVRMAFILATVHHLGQWTFLYLQYLGGPMVDFLSVVAFYSLVTHGLARRLDARS